MNEKEQFISKLNALRKALVELNDFYASYHESDFDENDYFARAKITFTNKSFDEFNEEIINYIDKIID